MKHVPRRWKLNVPIQHRPAVRTRGKGQDNLKAAIYRNSCQGRPNRRTRNREQRQQWEAASSTSRLAYRVHQLVVVVASDDPAKYRPLPAGESCWKRPQGYTCFRIHQGHIDVDKCPEETHSHRSPIKTYIRRYKHVWCSWISSSRMAAFPARHQWPSQATTTWCRTSPICTNTLFSLHVPVQASSLCGFKEQVEINYWDWRPAIVRRIFSLPLVGHLHADESCHVKKSLCCVVLRDLQTQLHISTVFNCREFTEPSKGL